MWLLSWGIWKTWLHRTWRRLSYFFVSVFTSKCSSHTTQVAEGETRDWKNELPSAEDQVREHRRNLMVPKSIKPTKKSNKKQIHFNFCSAIPTSTKLEVNIIHLLLSSFNLTLQELFTSFSAELTNIARAWAHSNALKVDCHLDF